MKRMIDKTWLSNYIEQMEYEVQENERESYVMSEVSGDLVILGFFKLVALTLFSALNTGFSLSMSWNLFMPQYFHLPKLSVLIAICVSALLSLLTVGLVTVQRDSEGQPLPVQGDVFVAKLVYPWIMFLVIWIATSIYY